MDNVKKKKKTSYKPKQNGGSTKEKIESAFKFMKNHVIWLEGTTPLPITSRAATMNPVAPMDPVNNDV